VQYSPETMQADAASVTKALLTGLADCLQIVVPDRVCAGSHRWRYPRSGAQGVGPLHNPAHDLGVCGDWLIGPGVESAWRSGSLLGKLLSGQKALDYR
jgi:predicted NAD/FAD-dependent oxidoreductase